MDYAITYSPDPSMTQLFTTYSDTNHGGCKDTGRSTGAYIVKIGTGVVSWMSKRQSIVALSTTEAEYMAACEAGKEIVWMRKMLQELGFPMTAPSVLYMDNQSAIQVAKHPERHGQISSSTCPGSGCEMWSTKAHFGLHMYPLATWLLICSPRHCLASRWNNFVRKWVWPHSEIVSWFAELRNQGGVLSLLIVH